MAVGFRKSLFGFNSSDVLEYIEKTHKTFVEKEKKLNSKVDNLLNELEAANQKQEILIAEKQELTAKLDEFNAKYDEIERLSENIGKLYLVAQANAQAIMENSENSAKISDEEVTRNLSAIDEAHESLKEVRENITKMSESFVLEVNKLIASLDDTKEQINTNTENIDEAKNQFHEIYNSIVR